MLSPQAATSWAQQLPALRDAGIRHITFTGGEPVLALPAICLLAESAARLGISTAVVTSGAWASSPTAAAKVVEKLGAISHWDLGYDQYHASEIPFERFQQAVQALQARGASFSVRACVHAPLQPEERELCARIRAVIGPDAPLYTQSVRRIGRASDLAEAARQPGRLPLEPCMSSGPLVREDGTVGPCCSGLAYEARGRHPFEFGNVHEDGLVACRQRWLEDPLLRLVRLVGFAIPLQWLQEAGLEHLLPEEIPPGVCELCVALWDAQGQVGQYLRERAAQPEVVAQLDRLEKHLFD
jgi:hypothetical protein